MRKRGKLNSGPAGGKTRGFGMGATKDQAAPSFRFFPTSALF